MFNLQVNREIIDIVILNRTNEKPFEFGSVKTERTNKKHFELGGFNTETLHKIYRFKDLSKTENRRRK